MRRLFSDGKPWFRPKSFGYGTGLPTAWQGWVLMLGFIAAMTVLAVLASLIDGIVGATMLLPMALLTAAFVRMAKARTEGEWRWGDEE